MSHAILFVHLGPQLPPWLDSALRQARLFNACSIILAAESRALARGAVDPSLKVTQLPLEEVGISERHRNFLDISPLDQSFRQGFWRYTTERFFAVESVMSRLALRDVVHLENDVLLYCDLDALIPKLSAAYKAMAATFDNDDRCIPGFMYISSVSAATALANFIIAELRAARASPDAARILPGINDMALLGMYRAQGRATIDHLPIIPPDYDGPLRSLAGHVPRDAARYRAHFDELGMVFDAAAIGQYLGGIDPRNDPRPSKGFVNESCVFDVRRVKPRMALDVRGRRVPVIETGSGIHPVANLHMHSKNLEPFLSA